LLAEPVEYPLAELVDDSLAELVEANLILNGEYLISPQRRKDAEKKNFAPLRLWGEK
jgi:hypothetical protein